MRGTMFKDLTALKLKLQLKKAQKEVNSKYHFLSKKSVFLKENFHDLGLFFSKADPDPDQQSKLNGS